MENHSRLSSTKLREESDLRNPSYLKSSPCHDLEEFWMRVPLKFISAFIFESILPKFGYDEGGDI